MERGTSGTVPGVGAAQEAKPDKYGWYRPDVIPPIAAWYPVYCESPYGSRFHADVYWSGEAWSTTTRGYSDGVTVLAWRHPRLFDIPEWLEHPVPG